MIYKQPLLKPSGDKALRICFGDERSLEVNQPVRTLYKRLINKPLAGITEMVPTYASLTVMYDPQEVILDEFSRSLDALAQEALAAPEVEVSGRLLMVPVCYEEPYAPDMDYICEHTSLTAPQAISQHTAAPYQVFQLGFTPGCPFIGPLQPSLHVPLMEAPRTHTPTGAVAISVGQTVIYPRATPGGMRIIGRTPVRLFQIDHPELTLFKPGDRVWFRAITPAEFEALASQCQELMQGVEVRLEG
ncbi:MAG: allophanate hydrolase subunit 1 [Desulfarculaceae bacterium]|jgi:inhibitor of KinA